MSLSWAFLLSGLYIGTFRSPNFLNPKLARGSAAQLPHHEAQFSTDGAVVNGVSHDDLYALWCRVAACGMLMAVRRPLSRDPVVPLFISLDGGVEVQLPKTGVPYYFLPTVFFGLDLGVGEVVGNGFH